MPRLIRLVTADAERRDAFEAQEFGAEEVTIRHKPEGIVIEPKSTVENPLGFIRMFVPWQEVRQIKEYDA